MKDCGQLELFKTDNIKAIDKCPERRNDLRNRVSALIDPETGDELMSYAADRLKAMDKECAFKLVSMISKLRQAETEITWELFCEFVAQVRPDALKEWNRYIRGK